MVMMMAMTMTVMMKENENYEEDNEVGQLLVSAKEVRVHNLLDSKETGRNVGLREQVRLLERRFADVRVPPNRILSDGHLRLGVFLISIPHQVV